MRKSTTSTQILKIEPNLDTVGVAGSIPVEPTIQNTQSKIEIIEITGKDRVIPAIRWVNGLPELYRVLIKSKAEMGT